MPAWPKIAQDGLRALAATMPRAEAEAVMEDLVDAYEERAAIMEFCGCLPRAEAERQASALVFGRAAAAWRKKGRP